MPVRATTLSGPNWSSFGMRDRFEQTLAWFTSALFDDGEVDVRSAAFWTDDAWFLDQDNRKPIPNEGWWPLRPGHAEGPIIGGNLCTLNLLQGTPYFPPLEGAVLFVEDDELSNPVAFARDLTSLLQVPGALRITGLVIGRFQRASGMTRGLLDEIVARQPALTGLPVLANVDFGHTDPRVTFPIGGSASLSVGDEPRLQLTAY